VTGPAPPLLDPPRHQVLVGAGHPAQFRYGLPPGLELRAFALARAEREPGGLGQQVRAVTGDLP
jgi:hypothetical protein